MIEVTLLDSELSAYQYEMKLTLRMPHVYFSTELLTFGIINGEYSDYSLPDVVLADGYALQEVLLVSNDAELSNYIAYNEIDSTISYNPL